MPESVQFMSEAWSEGIRQGVMRGFWRHFPEFHGKSEAWLLDQMDFVGCSSIFTNYTMVQVAFEQVNTLFNVKTLVPKYTQKIISYDELGILTILPMIAEQRKWVGHVSPYMDVLRKHDKEHKSELVRTLAAYLTCNSNPKETSALLHIHVNTLGYRLNRITELTGRSLKETGFLLMIYLDLLLDGQLES
jgi:DNA-binding PucR family transcriptional regulator